MATNNELNSGSTPLVVNQGGTGITSTVVYTPLCGGITSTSALQSVASVGTSGDILTSQGSAAPVYTSGLGVSPITYVKVAISSSELKTMRVTPKLLVAAGGANTLLVVNFFVFEYKFITAAYTGGGNVFIQWDSTTLAGGLAAAGPVTPATIGMTSTVDCDNIIEKSAQFKAGSTTVNKGLYLTNATAAFATGAGTVNIHLYYSVLATTI